MAAAPPVETLWTLGVVYTGGTTYTGPYQLYLRAQFGGTTVALRDGEVSAPIVRRPGFAEYVRVEMGSSYDPGFPYRWECTGDVSGLSVGTTEQFVPAIDPMDSTMDCVFIIDNTDPPTVNVVTTVDGDPAGDVSFDYAVDYNFFGTWPIAAYSGSDGTSRAVEGVAEFPIRITATPTGATPATTQTDIRCYDAADNYITGYGSTVSIAASGLAAGAVVTCRAIHTVPATIAIVEDVVPDDPSAPPASYTKRSFTTVENVNNWNLADGETQTFVFRTSFFGDATFSRDEVPGWDLTGIDCMEDLGGGVMSPYSAYSVDLGVSRGTLSVPLPAPGTDLICRFVAEPAGPPSVQVALGVNAVDLSAYSDFDVEVRDSGGVLIEPEQMEPLMGTEDGFGMTGPADRRVDEPSCRSGREDLDALAEHHRPMDERAAHLQPPGRPASAGMSPRIGLDGKRAEKLPTTVSTERLHVRGPSLLLFTRTPVRRRPSRPRRR